MSSSLIRFHKDFRRVTIIVVYYDKLSISEGIKQIANTCKYWWKLLRDDNQKSHSLRFEIEKFWDLLNGCDPIPF